MIDSGFLKYMGTHARKLTLATYVGLLGSMIGVGYTGLSKPEIPEGLKEAYRIERKLQTPITREDALDARVVEFSRDLKQQHELEISKEGFSQLRSDYETEISKRNGTMIIYVLLAYASLGAGILSRLFEDKYSAPSSSEVVEAN